jgi:hypothetical protein
VFFGGRERSPGLAPANDILAEMEMEMEPGRGNLPIMTE